MKYYIVVILFLHVCISLFSQELLVPGKCLNDKNQFIPEGTVSYMSVVRDDSFDPIKWCLYFDVKCKEFVAVSYNDSTNIHSPRYHCKLEEETAIAISELFTSTVASSSYLADYLFFDGIIYDIETKGFKAYTIKDENNSLFTDTLDKIIIYTSQGNRQKIDEMLPIIQSLTEIYRGYSSMPNKNYRLRPLSHDFFVRPENKNLYWMY